jgi:hypothetical protein
MSSNVVMLAPNFNISRNPVPGLGRLGKNPENKKRAVVVTTADTTPPHARDQ